MREIKYRVIMDGKAYYWGFIDGCFVGPTYGDGYGIEDVKKLSCQHTGLKDKNGKEIYEGDVVQCTHWFFDGNEVEENFTAKVGFKNGSFTLEDIDSRFYSNYTGEENGKGICWIGDINYCEDDYEVIGNIYEQEAANGQS